jgi:hypothetical protein
MPSDVPPPSQHDARAPLVVRFGSALLVGAVAALACTLPASMRVVATLAGGPDTLRVWLALGAAALAPMVVAVGVLRGARVGLRAYVGPGAGARAFGVALWLALLFSVLALFGDTLRATTHHHALAGVTFAMGAVVVAVGLAVACARIVGLVQNGSANVRRAVIALATLVAVLGVAFVSMRFARALSRPSDTPSTAGGTLVDMLAFVIAAAFASRPSLAGRRVLMLAGPPLAVAVLALGISLLRGDPSVCDAIAERAPIYLPIVQLVSGR